MLLTLVLFWFLKFAVVDFTDGENYKSDKQLSTGVARNLLGGKEGVWDV